MAITYPNEDLTGRQFNRLTVREFVGRNLARREALWLCDCSCGGTIIVLGSCLKSLRRLSCGCLSSRHTLPIRNTTHAKRHLPEYDVWAGMKNRCYNPNDKRYSRYGGRGIRVCDRWLTDFAAFYEDMGPRPPNPQGKRLYSIERNDNDGDYTPENCYWATAKIQARNSSANHLITFQGTTKCLAEWAETLGINQHMLRYRMERDWPIELAFTLPSGSRSPWH